MQKLSILSCAVAGLLIILLGTFISGAIYLPSLSSFLSLIDLKSTFQVPSVLMCSIVFGPEAALISVIAYITIGLFYLPIFHGGGSIGYLLSPSFGYVIGFIPAVFICGSFTKSPKTNKFITNFLGATLGLAAVHMVGIFFLILALLTSVIDLNNFYGLILNNSLLPITHQLLIVPAIAIMSIALKKILFIK